MRPLTTTITVAGEHSRYVLDGVPKMREGPIGDLVDGLSSLMQRLIVSLVQNIPQIACSLGLLDQLLEAQKLDTTDIEDVIHAYYNIISQPCMVCGQLDKDQSSKRYNSLHSISMEESLKIVRDYLIAATAKDLSMIISFRPRESGNVESSYNIISLESTNQRFDYKVLLFCSFSYSPLDLEYHAIPCKINLFSICLWVAE